MADSTLDDFFAKKDKSKKKKKGGKTKSGEMTDVLKKDSEKSPFSSNNQVNVVPSLTNEQEDDEWKNIEEKEADYSGLRIQALSISEKEKEEEQLKEQMLSEQNGESMKHTDGQSGPWKVVSTPTAETVVEETSVEEEAPPPPAEETPKPAGTYKPPALRNAQQGGSTPSVPFGSASRRSRHAPQITSEVHFPSLSSVVDSKYKLSESDRTFQSVKHGVKSKGESQNELKLDLENKFSALHHNE